jgi:hypothetical protein
MGFFDNKKYIAIAIGVAVCAAALIFYLLSSGGDSKKKIQATQSSSVHNVDKELGGVVLNNDVVFATDKWVDLDHVGHVKKLQLTGSASYNLSMKLKGKTPQDTGVFRLQSVVDGQTYNLLHGTLDINQSVSLKDVDVNVTKPLLDKPYMLVFSIKADKGSTIKVRDVKFIRLRIKQKMN